MNTYIFIGVLCCNLFVYADKKEASYIQYLRTFGRSASVGFAQGTVNGTFARAGYPSNTEIRSGTWLCGTVIETALHWKSSKDYSSQKVAVGFFGLGVGQIVGEVCAGIGANYHHAKPSVQDLWNMNLIFASVIGGVPILYSYLTEKKETKTTAEQPIQ